MEEYLIFFAIGGLLLLTLLVNSVSEAYEYRQREKRIRILKIKQGLEEISQLLERLKIIEFSKNIRDLLLNEIMARLQAIQGIDRNFRGIQALIDEATEESGQQSTAVAPAGFIIKDENQFRKTMVLFRQLLQRLNSNQWYSGVRPEMLKNALEEVKLLRCEKIFQFYTDKARLESEQNNYLVAKEHYHYILHALKQSGISSNPRILELIEQTELLSDQASQIMSSKVRQIVNDEMMEESSEKDQENVQSENNAANGEEKQPQQSAAATAQNSTAQPAADAK